VTNTFVGILALTVILLASSLVSILISSLMLIGTSADIGQMYLQRFLPQLFGLGFVGFIGYCSYSIYRGKNMSKLMTLVLMGVAGALLVATLITVPIKAHTGSSNSSSNSRSSNYSSLYDY
jgi:xanthine/uracil permease